MRNFIKIQYSSPSAIENILLVIIFSLSLLTTGKATVSKEDFVIKIPEQAFDLALKMSSGLIDNDSNGQSGLLALLPLKHSIEKYRGLKANSLKWV